LPLATPEPIQGALLPCMESSWNRGEIGSNVPLFASSFATNTEIGSFASLCQAAHILGLVIRHRDDHTNTNNRFRLSEAQQLHQTLVLLNNHLKQMPSILADSSIAVAASLCYAARFILYSMYACNEHYSVIEARVPEETEMQKNSISGLKEVTQNVYHLAQHIIEATMSTESLLLSGSLLLTHCLYQASTEFTWFIREDNGVEEVACLKSVVQLLRAIRSRWRIAGKIVRIIARRVRTTANDTKENISRSLKQMELWLL